MNKKTLVTLTLATLATTSFTLPLKAEDTKALEILQWKARALTCEQQIRQFEFNTTDKELKSTLDELQAERNKVQLEKNKKSEKKDVK